MSKSVIVSDLHIGDMSDADDFYTSGNFEKFIAFLEYIEKDEEIEKIIIAGDLFELWQCKVEKILQMYVDLWKVLLKLKETGKKIIYIPGNHDSLPFAKLVYKAAPFPFGPIQLTDKYDIDEKRKLIFPYYREGNLWVEHGHRFDIYNRDVSTLAGGSKGVIGYFIAKTIGIIEKMGAKNIDEQLENLMDGVKDVWRSLKNKFSSPFYKVAGNLQSYVTPASKDYKGNYKEYDEKGSMTLGEKLIEKGYEKAFVVLGHTHKPKIEKVTENIVYANSGSWVGKTPTFCVFDDEKKILSLYEWDEGRVNEVGKESI